MMGDPTTTPQPPRVGNYDYYTSVTGIAVNEQTGKALTSRPGDDYYGPPPKFYPPEKGYCLHCDMGMDLACCCEEPRLPKFPPMERWSEWGEFKGYSYSESEEPESALKDVRRFIEWLDTHEKSVNKRLALYRRQRPAP